MAPQNILKNKNILITAGSTWVAIDSVRVITNIFGGTLGLEIAEHAAKKGFKVTLLFGPGKSIPKTFDKSIKIIRYKYYFELLDLVKKHVSMKKYSVIIHSAAVADYTPENSFDGKIKSNKETLTIKLKRTIKIVDLIKKINKNIFLVKFKLEVNKSVEELILIAKKSMLASDADLIVANDFKNIKGSHSAYIINKLGDTILCNSKKEIASKLIKILLKNN